MTEIEEKLEKCEARCKKKSTDTAMLALQALYEENMEYKQYFLEEILKVALTQKGYNEITSKIPPRGIQKLPEDEECMWIPGVKPKNYENSN